MPLAYVPALSGVNRPGLIEAAAFRPLVAFVSRLSGVNRPGLIEANEENDHVRAR